MAKAATVFTKALRPCVRPSTAQGARPWDTTARRHVWGGTSPVGHWVRAVFGHPTKGKTPPASEQTDYPNMFEYKSHKEFQKDFENRQVPPEPKTVDDLMTPSCKMHQYTGLMSDEHYYNHYRHIAEPVLPRTPDSSKGELVAGATVTRTEAWNRHPEEPAILSVARYEPDNVRAVGYAENVKVPDNCGVPGLVVDFDETRLEPGHADRRPFYYFLNTFVLMGVAAVARGSIIRAVHSMWIPKDQQAFGTVEVDLTKVKEGDNMCIKWRGKPVFVRKRTAEQITKSQSEDHLIAGFIDPATDADRCPRPEWLVCMGVCTHLGCVPVADQGTYGGYFCPCHGSQYDLAGRVRVGPAPSNLEIPPHVFVTDDLIKLG